MRVVYILTVFLLISCSEDLPPGFPNTIEVVDSKSTNDCGLDSCSMDRITRFRAEELIVEYSFRGTLTFLVGFDSFVEMILCEELEGFEKRDQAKVWGELKDACGIAEANPPSEGIYIIHIEKIEKL